MTVVDVLRSRLVGTLRFATLRSSPKFREPVPVNSGDSFRRILVRAA
jgi:hypothetical protein